MHNDARNRLHFGDEPALVADRRRKPDKRQVSARWLAGTLLTGLTSSALMGIALAAALDGHRDLSSPQRVRIAAGEPDSLSDKGERLVAAMLPQARNRETIELSTMTKDGDREVIRTLPFGYVNMALAARNTVSADYPPFNAMTMFADTAGADADPASGADGAQIYGAKVESEMSLKMLPFTPADLPGPDDEASDAEAEALVRAASPTLSEKPVQVASAEPFDASRFASGGGGDVAVYEPGSAFRIVPENVSVAPRETPAEASRYAEEIIPFRETVSIGKALADSGYTGSEAEGAADALAEQLGSDELDAGAVLRVGSQSRDDAKRIVRLSAYRGTTHVATVAEADSGAFTAAAEPGVSDAVAQAFDENATEAPLRADMPTAYDGIYQAALAYGLNDRMCRQLLKILSPDIDFQARVGPEDRLVVFFTMDEGEETASDNSQILYVEASFGGQSKRYYRFRAEGENRYDYFDRDGRSAKQFLLRTPVPNGRFTSPFGGRVHPILGYARPHWGVDWAAPAGTPILASGDGVVESAGWTSGYGRQTIIRHANGYETSYSHQSAIARGVQPGAAIRQGQVIGAVGSSGLSTGNHLHYEVIVNGQKVDPMRIKFPAGHVLQGEELDTFRKERDRIDELLKDRAEAQRVAQR
ncbi:peptidoglycan DD-metalloendopeptidase family protein [Aureimonas leprariae]|uniref:Peptidoglycan DD-metalloendopeptidase family protein n=1 Tax=Plantimonas leprariae TaxID=2615207 RepID=A0A7V7PLA6_9HYPH|nr:peptidoglycan DD-metalloendopeptidase family protein [Aureimonas leprariae]KAB0677087.1 peptidoglycan DD-metalloendopeptidase family protein [Aureimonas leprariae]